jgi:hypothetical protein
MNFKSKLSLMIMSEPMSDASKIIRRSKFSWLDQLDHSQQRKRQ